MDAKYLSAGLLMLVLVAGCGGIDDTATTGEASPGLVASSPVTTAPTNNAINGGLDCLNDERFEGSKLFPAGVDGAATAKTAVREALHGYAERATDSEIVMVDGRQGSVVVDGREVVTTRASKRDEGWFAAEVSGCSDGWADGS